MLPIRLRFQGLHSYKSVADIDFSKLVDARLFGIFGATGSGKSTILEAITLALFSQSERLGSTFKYAAVNLSAQEMWIEFTFSQKNKEYLFEIKYTKSKKDIDSAAKLSYHKASEKIGNQRVAVAEKTTEVKAFAETIL
jgi:exonuclease SbcC